MRLITLRFPSPQGQVHYNTSTSREGTAAAAVVARDQVRSGGVLYTLEHLSPALSHDPEIKVLLITAISILYLVRGSLWSGPGTTGFLRPRRDSIAHFIIIYAMYTGDLTVPAT